MHGLDTTVAGSAALAFSFRLIRRLTDQIGLGLQVITPEKECSAKKRRLPVVKQPVHRTPSV
jgi:hypothetical protein